MINTEINSLDQLRQEKDRVRRQVDNGVRRLRNDLADVVSPRGSFAFASTNKYLNYIGYAFTAYKVVTTVMGVVRMFKRKKK